jgi:hypothetical protein
MLNSINGIITLITKKYRLLALILLLLTIIVLTLGPKFLEIINHDDNALNQRIELQKETIKKLNKEINDLNNDVIQSNLSCTDKIVEREKEILDKILNIESSVKKPNRLVKEKSQVIVYDTITSVAMSAPIQVPDQQTQTNDDLTNKIKNLKKDLINSIKSKENH